MRRSMWLAAIVAMTTGCAGHAWALAGGGTAPGGPLSGRIRPSCDGYNMDGTVDPAPDARRSGCVDHSARGRHGTGAPGRSSDE